MFNHLTKEKFMENEPKLLELLVKLASLGLAGI
jgi:hypothetical protein